MKCEHCEKPISFLSNYCEHCGKPVKSAGTRISNTTKTIFTKTVDLCKKKKWILPAVLGIVVVLIAVSVITNHEKTLDFTDYVSFEVSGYDGYGTLDIEINYDELAEDVLGKIPNSESKKEYEKYTKYINDKDTLKYLVSARVDKTQELKNGDFFLVTVNVEDSDIFAKHKIAIKEDNYTKTFEIGTDTEKLTGITEINLFETMPIEFSGVNGYGNANISNEEFTVNVEPAEGDAYTLNFAYYSSGWSGAYFAVSSSSNENYEERIYVSFENDSNLSNGDTVKVSLEYSEETLVEAFGVKLVETEKEIAASNLTEITEVNLFDHFSVEFTGENEYGKATVSSEEFTIDITPANGEKYTLTLQYNGSSWGTPYFKVYSSLSTNDYETVYMSFDNSRYLSNGDVVKATIEADEEDLAKLLGIKISATEKEYTVSGLTTEE